MISSGEWLTPTRVGGIAVYTAAFVCSAIAWARTRDARGAWLAPFLTAVEGLLLLDMIVNGRWLLHQALMNFALRRHEYDLRRLPQEIVVTFLVAILSVGLLFALWSFRARIGALLAISGVLISLISWCIEVISLHAVDAVLYHPIERWMIVNLVWTLACLLTSVGILVDSRQVNMATNQVRNASRSS